MTVKRAKARLDVDFDGLSDYASALAKNDRFAYVRLKAREVTGAVTR